MGCSCQMLLWLGAAGKYYLVVRVPAYQRHLDLGLRQRQTRSQRFLLRWPGTKALWPVLLECGKRSAEHIQI